MNEHSINPTDAAQSSAEPLELLDRRLAYTLFRVALGVYLLHGATHLFDGAGAFPRLPLEILPPALTPFLAAGLASLAAGLGLLLALGLWTRGALIGGGALMTVLLMGAAPRTDTETLTVQMFYLGMFYLLPPAGQYNIFSADALREKFADGSR